MSNTSEPPSSMRWSSGMSGNRPCGHQLPAAWPTDSGDRIEQGRFPPGLVVQAAGVEHELPDRDARRGPAGLGDPAPRQCRVGGLGRHAVLHPHAHRRLVDDARLDALQPLVPPAQGVLQEPDRRSRQRHVREPVRPLADQRLLRPLQPGHESRDRVRVAVRPAADGVDGAPDGAEVLAHRTVLPERVAALVTAASSRSRGRCLRGAPSTSRASDRRRRGDRADGRCTRTWSRPSGDCWSRDSRPCSGRRRHSGRRSNTT